MDACRAVFVGDAVWDVEACERAGVQLSGGVSRGELEKAGAKAVFENVLDLCEPVDGAPIATFTNALFAR